MDEALELVNDREKPLVAYVFTNDNAVYQRFLKETSSGAIVRNDTIMHVCGRFLYLSVLLSEGLGLNKQPGLFSASELQAW